MYPRARRKIINRLIRVRNMKIFLVVQSCITTSAVIYMMLQTSNLDEISKLEERVDWRCSGCCIIKKENVEAITGESQLSEKLHKISRAIRNYEIPDYILKILHDGEKKLDEFENELKKLKEIEKNRLVALQEIFIEEDTTTDEELTPRAKPKWKRLKQFQNTEKET